MIDIHLCVKKMLREKAEGKWIGIENIPDGQQFVDLTSRSILLLSLSVTFVPLNNTHYHKSELYAFCM